MDRVLSQEEIDSVFRRLREGEGVDDDSATAQPYDFRRSDRIAKDQLRAIHMLQETFARSLASSSGFSRTLIGIRTPFRLDSRFERDCPTGRSDRDPPSPPQTAVTLEVGRFSD